MKGNTDPKISCYDVERVDELKETIGEWLQGEPLSYDKDDLLYIKIVGTHLEIGRAEIKEIP